MKGKDLQKGVISMAHMYRWHVVHNPAVETKNRGWVTALAADAKGFPDLLLFRERCMAIEIKGDGDSLKPDQIDWRDRIQRSGIEWYCVRPSDWPDTVKEILT